MVDAAKYFSKWMSASQASEEARQCAAILYNDGDVPMGDRRLNHLAALTWNAQACDNIFRLLENAISPSEAPWKTIYKALLIVNTILLYGSELAVDKCINLCKFIHPLRTYNSALARKSIFSSGGTDYGAPVRAMATSLSDILMRDENIRQARASAKDQTTLVPLGEDFSEVHNPSKGVQSMTYGQGLTTSVGAGFGLEAVPGMYEGRPERYFDNTNDPRSRTTQGNAQHTRDKLAPDLLDLAFDSVESTTNTLPSADYLPALQKQQELEQKLKEQQELLRKLQEQQQLQEQMRATQAQAQAQVQAQQQQASLLDLQMPVSSGYPAQPYGTAAAYPPQQAQMAPNMMMAYPGAMPQYHPQPTNVPMYGNQPGYAAYGAPMPGQSQYPPQYQGMPPVSNPYHTANSAGYPSQMAAPSQPSPFSPMVMGPAAAPPVPGPALTPSYPGATGGGGANGGYNTAAPPSSAASKLFDAPQQAPQQLNNIYSQPPMQQQQQQPQSVPQPSQNMMNMGMFAPVSAPTTGLPPVAPPSTSSASTASSAPASSLARPPPVDIIDQDYIAYFSAQYQSHNINFDDAAPPPVIANTLPPRTRMNVRVLSRGNSIHEGAGSSPLHWSFDHNQTAVSNSANPHVAGVVNNNVGTPTFAETLSSTSSPSSSSHRIVVGGSNSGYSQPGPPGQPLQQQQMYQQYQQQPPYSTAQPQPDIFADIPMLAPPPVPSFQPPPDL